MLATLVALNRSTKPRSGICHALLHFAPGAVSQATHRWGVRIADVVALGQPVRYWPDGSARSVSATWYQKELAPGVSTLEVTEAQEGDELERPQGTTNLYLSMALANLRFLIGGAPLSWAFEMQEDNPLRFLATGYAQHDRFWSMLHLEGWHGTPVLQWAWRFGWSDPASPEHVRRFPGASLEYSGVQAAARHAKQKCKLVEPGRIVCVDGGEWNDGQSQLVRGCFVFGDVNDPAIAAWLPELEGPVRVMQAYPLQTGAFGMVGRVGVLGIIEPEVYDLVESQLAKRALGDPWQAGAWQPTAPGQAGDHRGFGLVGPAAALFAAAPNTLELMEFSSDQEACRPIWFRDAAGRPGKASQRLAWHVWDERPFKTGDLAGKAWPGLNIGTEEGQEPGAKSQLGEVWIGYDRQHGEDVTLPTYLLLTDDAVSKAMAEERVELLLGALRTDSGNPTIDGTDSGRGARALIMACRYLEVFPDREDLLACIQQRVELYVDQREAMALTEVMPQQVYAPTEQVGGLPTLPHWRPWEDAIVSFALLCAFQATGDVRALYLAGALGMNVVKHGYRQDVDGVWQIAVCLAWNDGKPLSEAQLSDPLMARWAEGTDYRYWSYVAAAVAWNAALSMDAMEASSQPADEQLSDDLARCKQILDYLASNVPSDISQRLERLEWLAIELLPAPEWLAARLVA